ncbi:hypothetical protein GCM10022233_76890 [Streptomyces shaanxiensis]|uniref:Uncharacterized protein n=1 Tax=Streptomyces shaanxiensis TaxID=653357 RepID=A0ABP7W8P5_9ACTN
MAVTGRSVVGVGQAAKPVEGRAAEVGFAEGVALLRGDALEADGDASDLDRDGEGEAGVEDATGRGPLASWSVELPPFAVSAPESVLVSSSTAATTTVIVTAQISKGRRSGLLRC